jgi:predicted transcriptional regulator
MKGVIKVPRLTIQFDRQIDKMLKELAERKGTTKVDILRRALAAYKYLDDEVFDDDGKRISVTSKENKILKDVILP